MIDLQHAKDEFMQFVNAYDTQDRKGFALKVTHTLKVMDLAGEIAERSGLSEEDVQLAQLIGLLHDIGRFEELTMTGKFDSSYFNHAEHGVHMLFEKGLIRRFTADSSYDEIIREAIRDHSLLQAPSGLDERTEIHVNIIRDADKLDNFRVKEEEPIETVFPYVISKEQEIEESEISEAVLASIMKHECVRLKDRVYPVDYLICILGFVFDLKYPVSYAIAKQRNDIDKMLFRYHYNNPDTSYKIELIRREVNNWINEHAE